MAWLGLNRPQKRNAIDSRLLAALHESVTRAQAEALATVIFGYGSCFSAGAWIPYFAVLSLITSSVPCGKAAGERGIRCLI
jgi:enoyl-CoA hydratase/carnithine racemase